MNKQQLIKVLKNPSSLDESTLDSLREILDEYPFFHAGRMLWIKNLHLLDSIKYNNELKLAAAHINNRAKLFELINTSYTLKDQAETIETQTKKTETAQSNTDLENYFQVDDVFTTQQGTKYNYSHTDFNQKPKKQEEVYFTESEEDIILPTGDLLDYELAGNRGYSLEQSVSINESYSFSEWLNILKSNKNITEEQPEKKRPKKDLIDSFLEKDKSKKIVFTQKTEQKEEEIKDISLKSVEEHDDLMTETLANIYIKQKQFLKAIEVLNRLRLKYPKKNIYFARRIDEIKELIDNQ